jgi:hypothetical protein
VSILLKDLFRYVAVNNGSDLRIKASAGLHAINPEECDVYSSLLDACQSGVITPGAGFTGETGAE